MKLVIDSGAESAAIGNGSEALRDRQKWTTACAERLIALRPGSNASVLQALAEEMSLSLAYFDPLMAAEMEVEGGMLDD